MSAVPTAPSVATARGTAAHYLVEKSFHHDPMLPVMGTA